MTKKILTILIGASFMLAGCGGGGGGGGGSDYIGAAEVIIDAQPRRIDTGDRVQVQVDTSRIHEMGIALKARYPVGLSFVRGSAYLELNRSQQDFPPTTAVSDDKYNYLVFFLTQNSFGPAREGTLVFELEGMKEVKDGKIEVDADVNDPDVNDANEFDVENPEFSADDSVTVNVTG